jgi:hypothetical protein
MISSGSCTPLFGEGELDDPNFERTEYQPFLGYGRSKTANILYAVALDNRLKGRGIRATALHPGRIQTELVRHMTPELRAQIQKRIAASKEAATFKYKPIPQGAATTVWASFVASADAVGGHYCEDCHVCEVNDDTSSRAGMRSSLRGPRNYGARASRWSTSASRRKTQYRDVAGLPVTALHDL